MAEGYLKSKGLKGIRVLSAGFISEGDAPSENAVSVMKEIGIDIAAHTSHLINSVFLSADKIFCMSSSHKSALVSAGADDEKISVLGDGISDPYGGDIEVYRKCRDEIIKAVNAALYGAGILPIKILKAEESDISAIAELEKECFSSHWSENAISEAMAHKTVFFKALTHKDPIGYIGVTAVAGEGYINNIAVRKDYRKQGAGSLLLDRAITFAREQNLEFISLEVRASNKAALSLYQNAGFKQEGKRKNFYDNPREDGIIMTRRFSR